MRVLVTGAAGFIGSHLCPALVDAGWDVAAFEEPRAAGATGVPRAFAGDVATGAGLDAAASGADAAVHLAARNHVLRETAADPLAEYRRVNVQGTRNAFLAASRAGARTFVHLSSVKAMRDESAEVLDEDSACAPGTPYGISKRESEDVLRELAARGGMRVVVVRLPMAYGPRNRGNLPRMIRWADSGMPFPLFRPDNLRSVVYVGNVAAAVLLALEKAPPGLSTYIVKDPEDCSTRALYEAICRELGRSPRFLPVPAWAARLGAALSGDVRRVTGSFRVSSERIRAELGYSPPFSLGRGIAETVAWYRRSVR